MPSPSGARAAPRSALIPVFSLDPRLAAHVVGAGFVFIWRLDNKCLAPIKALIRAPIRAASLDERDVYFLELHSPSLVPDERVTSLELILLKQIKQMKIGHKEMTSILHFLSWLGPLLTIAQLGGVGLVLWGSYLLLKSLHSEGPSARALGALRAELTHLARPLLAALGALALLLTLALIAHTTVTRWTMIIAPLSTFVWLARVSHSARRLKAGELLEALAPLSPPEEPLSPELTARAHAVAAEGRPLTGQALAETALRALGDARERPEGELLKRLPLSELIALLRDTLKELHAAARRLPFAGELTLADWEAEVRRVEREWEQSLSRVDLGRALVNPLTLVDKVPHLHPKTLLERELAAWLHAGLYALITRRLLALNAPAAGASAEQGLAADAQRGAPPQALLLSLFKTKLSAPTWLYIALLSAAAVEGYGPLGALAALAASGATWWALRETFSLSRLRASCERLSAFESPAPDADDQRAAEAAALIGELLKRSKEELGGPPRGGPP